jgi:3-hydroxy-9,10-secoandrosta-1,3,5(10)-triene-9,17-dione monooxygenase reductase component
MATDVEAVSAHDFKHALGHFASGVTVVTAVAEDGLPRGLTISAFSSLSLDPPLVLVCIAHTSESHDALTADDAPFAVNVLSDGQPHLAHAFAGKGGAAKFDDVPWHLEHGVPVIEGTHATLRCRVHTVTDGGDHTIVVGLVEEARTSDTDPLVHHRGRFIPTSGRPDPTAIRAWQKFVGDRTVPEFLRGLGFDPADRTTTNAANAVDAFLAQRRDSVRNLPRPHRLPLATEHDAAALIAHITRETA